NVFERNVVEIEVTAELEVPSHESAQPAPENPLAGDRSWQPAQRTQPFERGMARVVNKVAPITVLLGPAAGKDRRHARGAVAKDRIQTAPVRRNVDGEGRVPDDLPAAGVDENEERQNGFHHAGAGWGPAV